MHIRRNLQIFILGLAICLAFGCNKKADDNKTAQPQQNNAQTQDPEEAARIAARAEKVKAQVEKLRKEGKILAPRVDLRFNVVNTNERISFDDATRSWEYKRAPISRCYQEVLLFDETVKGEMSFKLARGTDEKIEVSAFKTTIADPDFSDCIKRALNTWRLPEQAAIEASITLNSRPAPTAEEIRKIYQPNSNPGNPPHEDHAGHQH